MQETIALSKEIFFKLKAANEKIMFVESCTGGNAAGNLVTNCPGVSEFFYGSQVVYTAAAKAKWLGIFPDTLTHCGTESSKCADLLASHAAARSNVKAFSVVGHLNDNSFIYTSYAKPYIVPSVEVGAKRFDLVSDNRYDRMQEAVHLFYKFVLECLASMKPSTF